MASYVLDIVGVPLKFTFHCCSVWQAD
jgi:hypothetical protein